MAETREPITPFAQADAEVGAEKDLVSDRAKRSERVTRKLMIVMADHDLNGFLGAYMSNLILPGLDMTQEQADRVLEVSRSTLRSRMSPADVASVERELAHDRWMEDYRRTEEWIDN